MKVVSAGFEREIDGSTRITARFRRGLRLHRELIDRIDRKHDARNVGDATLIDSGNVMPEVVVIDAGGLPMDLISARAVERAEAARGVAGESGCNADELREVAAIKRHG